MPKQRYEEVADDLRRKIEAGVYAPNTKLPSRTELGKLYEVSDTVLDKAMFILRREGLTETLPGVGVYVAERPAPPE